MGKGAKNKNKCEVSPNASNTAASALSIFDIHRDSEVVTYPAFRLFY
jgi:hypothetical protein